MFEGWDSSPQNYYYIYGNSGWVTMPSRIWNGGASNPSGVFASASTVTMYYPVTTSATTFYGRMCIYGGGMTNQWHYFFLRDHANAADQCYIAAQNNSTTGVIKVYRGGGTEVATSTANLVINPNGWNVIDFKLKISATVGEATVWLNSVQVINATGLNTKGSSGASIDRMGISSSSNDCFFDEVYLLDDQGSAPFNYRLTDPKIVAINANAAGDSSQFSCNSVGNNIYAASLHDDDSYYNYSSTVGQIDLYNLGNVEAAATAIYGVMPQVNVRKDDVPARTARLKVKSGATTDNGGDLVLTTSYQMLRKMYQVDPNTSAQWTPAAVNALQVGVEVLS